MDEPTDGQIDDEYAAALDDLLDLERRLVTGMPVGRTERREVNERYARADAARNRRDADRRRQAMIAAGEPVGEDQVMG